MLTLDRDIATETLDSILADAFDTYAKLGDGAYNATWIKKALKDWPAHLDADELLTFMRNGEEEGWDDLDVRAIAERLIETCDELGHLDSFPLRILWRRTTQVKNDRMILGTAGAVGKSEREKWPATAGAPPFWRMTLSLAAWLVMPARERVRLVHHELMHCGIDADSKGRAKPCTVAHDIEENAQTMARFGLGDRSQALVLAAAKQHPNTERQFREWFIDESSGQAALWPPPYGQELAN